MDATQRKVINIMESVMEDFCWRAQNLVDEEYCTQDDVLIALGGYPDFQDAWINWIEESE
jgi:hypothetical protein